MPGVLSVFFYKKGRETGEEKPENARKQGEKREKESDYPIVSSYFYPYFWIMFFLSATMKIRCNF